MDNVYWYYRLEWCFLFVFGVFFNKNKTKKREKLKPKKKHQIGTILSICSQGDPKSWQHPRAGAKGIWDHEAAPPWRRMKQWD